MHRLTALFAVGIVVSWWAGSAGGAMPPDRPLQVGDVAPDFSLAGSDGRTYHLGDYRGKQAVVLAWFAKAFSGG